MSTTLDHTHVSSAKRVPKAFIGLVSDDLDLVLLQVGGREYAASMTELKRDLCIRMLPLVECEKKKARMIEEEARKMLVSSRKVAQQRRREARSIVISARRDARKVKRNARRVVENIVATGVYTALLALSRRKA